MSQASATVPQRIRPGGQMLALSNRAIQQAFVEFQREIVDLISEVLNDGPEASPFFSETFGFVIEHFMSNTPKRSQIFAPPVFVQGVFYHWRIMFCICFARI